MMFCGLSGAAGMPSNAHAKVFAAGWECDDGFAQRGTVCARVVVPDHGRLNLLGNGWECLPGYSPRGEACVLTRVPDHAGLDPFGKGWNCLPGFYREEEKCIAIKLPPNARLDSLGKSWECDSGFKEHQGSCVEMSDLEKAEEVRRVEALGPRAVSGGPEGSSCHAAYNKCTSVCYQPVYDQATGRSLKNTDFIQNCSLACSQAEAGCSAELAKDQCPQFGRICRETCPETVHDLDLGQYLTATNAKSVCEKACHYGTSVCDYHARRFRASPSL